jgi:hypothetical protein
MAKENIGKLHAVVQELLSKRQAFVDGITEIDKAFAALGVRPAAMRKKPGRPVGRPKAAAAAAAPAKKKRGRPVGSTSKGRPRGSGAGYKSTASDLVLSVIRKHANGASGSALSKAWKSAGRSGEPYNTLGELVRTGQIAREKIEGRRGSIYRIAK